ncbi:hypothetical protein [Effusibacillus consociatus]|uniref:Uncharacterized protein n=1 Tax=Effusibacillus consociatus TaxID=1117041 RepID=A0ABV9Q354_9BACL
MKLKPVSPQIESLWNQLANLSLHELYLLRAQYSCEQGMLGNIPLMASTVPLVFLIFGGHVSKYLPSHNFLWIVVMVLSVIVIVWALTYHFRLKGSTACCIYLVDLAIRQKERNQGRDSP